MSLLTMLRSKVWKNPLGGRGAGHGGWKARLKQSKRLVRWMRRQEYRKREVLTQHIYPPLEGSRSLRWSSNIEGQWGPQPGILPQGINAQ